MEAHRRTARVGATVRNGSNASEWHAETMRDDDALARLAADWDDLYERCSAATAFVSFAWLDAWWHSYGKPGQLLVVTVRHAGQLVAAAAFTRRNRLGLPTLTPIGAGISDFSDILLDDRYAAEAAGRLTRELARHSGHIIDLPEVPQGAAVWQVAREWPYRTWRMRSSTCLDLPARPLDELIETLPRRAAGTRRTKSRKIKRAGITTRIVESPDAARAVATLMALHREQWRGRGINPEHGRPRFAAHLGRAVPAMVGRGQAVLIEHAHEGHPVAVDLLIGGNRMMGAYLYGLRPELRRRIDVVQLLLQDDLEIAARHGVPTLSLLRGDEAHKRAWRPRETHNERLLLACSSLPATAYALGVRGRHQLAVFVKTRIPLARAAVRTVRRCLRFST